MPVDFSAWNEAEEVQRLTIMANTDYWHSFQVVVEIIPISRNLATIQPVVYLLDKIHRFNSEEEKEGEKGNEHGGGRTKDLQVQRKKEGEKKK